MTLPPLRLKRNEERRLRAGHLWVYSNEVDTAVTPLGGFAPGDAVEIQAHNGRPIGTGYVNPHSLICARLVSRDAAHPIGPSLLVHRLKVALALRERLHAQPYYRLVYGDSDGLPGLVVDRYGDYCVAQANTAGIERMRAEVEAALVKVLAPRGVLWRNDSAMRALEGLPEQVETGIGEVPERIAVVEGSGRFEVAPAAGQKTGWFYDQADNRARLARYVRDARVLDVFSYVGAWGVQAALAGAREVTCVDASGTALEQAAANAVLSGVGDRVTTLQGDAFDVLKGLREGRERFDVVIVDPPAFIKRKKDLSAGTQAYRRINELAMQVLERDGLLVSCSCSHHLSRDSLNAALLAGARHLDRSMQIIEQGHQAVDHPVHPAIPETDYLKAAYARVLPA